MRRRCGDRIRCYTYSISTANKLLLLDSEGVAEQTLCLKTWRTERTFSLRSGDDRRSGYLLYTYINQHDDDRPSRPSQCKLKKSKTQSLHLGFNLDDDALRCGMVITSKCSRAISPYWCRYGSHPRPTPSDRELRVSHERRDLAKDDLAGQLPSCGTSRVTNRAHRPYGKGNLYERFQDKMSSREGQTLSRGRALEKKGCSYLVLSLACGLAQ